MPVGKRQRWTESCVFAGTVCAGVGLLFAWPGYVAAGLLFLAALAPIGRRPAVPAVEAQKLPVLDWSWD